MANSNPLILAPWVKLCLWVTLGLAVYIVLSWLWTLFTQWSEIYAGQQPLITLLLVHLYYLPLWLALGLAFLSWYKRQFVWLIAIIFIPVIYFYFANGATWLISEALETDGLYFGTPRPDYWSVIAFFSVASVTFSVNWLAQNLRIIEYTRGLRSLVIIVIAIGILNILISNISIAGQSSWLYFFNNRSNIFTQIIPLLKNIMPIILSLITLWIVLKQKLGYLLFALIASYYRVYWMTLNDVLNAFNSNYTSSFIFKASSSLELLFYIAVTILFIAWIIDPGTYIKAVRTVTKHWQQIYRHHAICRYSLRAFFIAGILILLNWLYTLTVFLPNWPGVNNKASVLLAYLGYHIPLFIALIATALNYYTRHTILLIIVLFAASTTFFASMSANFLFTADYLGVAYSFNTRPILNQWLLFVYFSLSVITYFIWEYKSSESVLSKIKPIYRYFSYTTVFFATLVVVSNIAVNFMFSYPHPFPLLDASFTETFIMISLDNWYPIFSYFNVYLAMIAGWLALSLNNSILLGTYIFVAPYFIFYAKYPAISVVQELWQFTNAASFVWGLSGLIIILFYLAVIVQFFTALVLISINHYKNSIDEVTT